MLSFGKYKGKSIPDIYQQDRPYLEWLMSQAWFKSRFPSLHETVSTILRSTVDDAGDKDRTVVYTDGSCKNNGSRDKSKVRSGVGVHFSSQNDIPMDDISLKFPLTNPTNNRAELYAILVAIRTCYEKDVGKVVIYTDSEYSLKCITEWYPNWVSKNDLKNRKNLDILPDIAKFMDTVDVAFHHIRAHTGLTDKHSLGNERADSLANACL